MLPIKSSALVYGNLVYNPWFEIAAMILLLFLVVMFLANQRIVTRRMQMLTFFMFSMLLDVMLNIISVFTISFAADLPLYINYIVNSLFFCARITTQFTYVLYVMAFTGYIREENKKKIIALSVFYIIGIIGIATNYLHKWMFYFDQDTYEYKHGAPYYFFVAYGIVFLIVGSVLLKKHQMNITRNSQRVINSYIIIWVLALVIQLVIPQMLTAGLFYTALAFVIYSRLENPAFFRDPVTGLYAFGTFNITNHRKYKKDNMKVFVCLRINDFNENQKIWADDFVAGALRNVANVLIAYAPKDYKFRMSYNQFCIVMDKTIVADFASKVKDQFLNGIYVNEVRIKLNVDIFQIPMQNEVYSASTYEEWLPRVLEHAKPTIYNAYTILSSADVNEACRGFIVEKAVNKAIKNKSFEVYFEPIFSVRKKHFVGCEALIRLKDDHLGYIPPDEFVTMAETNGNINEIGSIVLEKVCEFMARHDLTKLGLNFVDVNLSAIQCMQETLAEDILRVVDKYKVDISLLNFEITETALGVSKDTIKRNMHKLIKAGAIFSMDDFGTGYSNLNYLTQMPFHIVKIDKKLLYASYTDKRSEQLLDKLVPMFHELGIEVVCEGAEKEHHIEKLCENGVDYIQGYYFAKPMDGTKLVGFLTKYNSERF